VRLTDRGRKAQTAGFKFLDQIERRWGEQYDASQMREMHALLERHAAGPRWREASKNP
jgi:hypothetical protein